MFVLAFIVMFFVTIIIVGCQDYSDNRWNKIFYQDKKTNTYIDKYGNDRDVETNRLVTVNRWGDGDLTVQDMKTGTIIRNYSRLNLEKRINRAIISNDPFVTVVPCDVDERPPNVNKFKEPEGARYIDIQNRNIYVVRRYKGRYYYMDLCGEFIRNSDGQKWIDHNYPEYKKKLYKYWGYETEKDELNEILKLKEKRFESEYLSDRYMNTINNMFIGGYCAKDVPKIALKEYTK